MRILVLSVPVGSGHIKAAGAVEQALTRLTPKAQIRSENCFHPNISSAPTFHQDTSPLYIKKDIDTNSVS
ncbi:hypothetical protein BXT86_03290 [candidate division WOR-3 bacterium 4484_100]|uniref:Diacylglycerol glucosyltransferase N-terminal domain-containing protein n=1 Tax=candidate division WOR-3 bacterium 4484_100 TaxID=1936077 RepID=A0A1V4QFA3_UNCW3|nr:MAG: hypothetical protein BXT86_03290 [candidate division WOR-3 bacterium 4484_100]